MEEGPLFAAKPVGEGHRLGSKDELDMSYSLNSLKGVKEDDERDYPGGY